MKNIPAFLLAAAALLAATAAYGQGTSDSTLPLKEVMGLIEANYLDTIHVPVAAQGSLDSILSYLDPQSAYLPARQMQENDPSRD